MSHGPDQALRLAKDADPRELSDRALYAAYCIADDVCFNGFSDVPIDRVQQLRAGLQQRGIQSDVVACQFCHYWHQQGQIGECRRRAPFSDGFPITSDHHWCGDFTAVGAGSSV